jgi:hypothetical protein
MTNVHLTREAKGRRKKISTSFWKKAIASARFLGLSFGSSEKKKL